MKVLWIETCDDCPHRSSIGWVDLCGHPGFKGTGRSREIKNGVIPEKLCPLPGAATGHVLEDKEPKS